MVQTSDASVTVQLAPLTLNIQPQLTFVDRSHDGAPVVFVPAANREHPRLFVKQGRLRSEHCAELEYKIVDQGGAALRVESTPGRAIEVEAINQRSPCSFCLCRCRPKLPGGRGQ